MRIGVFDSGKGGTLIAERLSVSLPGHKWPIVDDIDNVPYGEKSQDEIISLTDAAIQPLIADCQVVVIACNTATTAAITELRRRYPDTQFVGVEPMIKPAALHSTQGHITVLATPYTLKSARYQALKHSYAAEVIVDEPSTPGWPLLIDSGRSSDIDFSAVDKSIENGSDTVALACTHYLDLMTILSNRYPEVTILEPSEALARQIEHLITESSV